MVRKEIIVCEACGGRQSACRAMQDVLCRGSGLSHALVCSGLSYSGAGTSELGYFEAAWSDLAVLCNKIHHR